jgi:hypothetical protein
MGNAPRFAAFAFHATPAQGRCFRIIRGLPDDWKRQW